MKPVLTALFMSLTGPVFADHVAEFQGINPLQAYQHDAANKRYADILKIADLIEDYINVTGAVPQLDPAIPPGSTDASLYEVAILGQPAAVDAVFRNGTPFGFSLVKFRPEVLLDVLRNGLNRPVTLPIDPQNVGTHFAPVYFVFLRRETDTAPAHYIVMGTFALPVARSTMVAPDVHIVAISNASVPFIVDVQARASLDAGFVAHALDEGALADALFAPNVATGLQ